MKSIKMRQILLYLMPVMLITVVIISCGDSPQVRKYKEEVPPAQAAQAPQSPHQAPGKTETMPAHAHFQWDTPEGWTEDRTSSGFRLASFSVGSGDNTSICTIIPLQGEAGGLEANVSRWLAQVSVDRNPDEKTVQELLNTQEKFLTKGQFPAIMIDFTTLNLNPTDKSILAAILTVQGNSIFVKMTGPKSHLIENKSKFKALCRSFSF